MNDTEWLYEATQDMPQEIQNRIRAETLDHLEDADARNAADVTASLGDARQVNRELRRLYLSGKEWEVLMKGPADARTLLGYPLLVWLVLDDPINLFSGVYQFLTLFFLTLFYALTQPLHPVRRVRWHFQLIGMIAILMGVLNAQTIGGLSFLGWLLLAVFSYGFVHNFLFDQRLKRTLQIVGAPANSV